MYKYKVYTLALLLLICTNSSITYASAYKDSIADSLSPASDISDVYFFRSWENPDNVVLIMNVFSGQNPSDGPIVSVFDEDVIYRLNIDNNMDGDANDVIYEFQFRDRISEIDELEQFPFPYVGNPSLPYSDLQGITSLTGKGSNGIRFKQYYSVREINRNYKKEKIFNNRRMLAVPPNAGNLVMPNYEALAAHAIYEDANSGIRVFAGQRAESTYVDLASFYNGLEFERMPPFLTQQEDIDDTRNAFGSNRFNNTNVNTIAIEIPIDRLTVDKEAENTTTIPFLGLYASAYERKTPSKYFDKWRLYKKNGRLKQVSRMANPTFNILITDFQFKDRYNKTNPKFDAQYQNFIKQPSFADYLSVRTGLPVPPEPRLGILGILYKYPGQQLDGENCGNPCADLLHLNVQVPPTMPESQSRLGSLLSPDAAGLPNGRRPNDDVYDITLRAFGGPAFFAARIGDGVNFAENLPGSGTDDGAGYGKIAGNKLDVTINGIVKEFPFLATPYGSLR